MSPRKKNNIVPDFFNAGPYGDRTGAFYAKHVAVSFRQLFSSLDEDVAAETNTLVTLLAQGEPTIEQTASVKNPMNMDLRFKFNKETEETVKNSVSHFYSLADDALKGKKGEDAKKFYGFLKFFKAQCDFKSGNYAQATAENPLIDRFSSVASGMPHFERYVGKLGDLAKELDDKKRPDGQVTRPGLLKPLNDFFSAGADIIEAEYERQRLNKQKSIAAREERAFLRKYDKALLNAINAFDKLEDLCDEKGKSAFDSLLNNPLDQIVGIGTAETSKRSMRYHVAMMKGMHEAIKNGWGMNQLNACGFAAFFLEKAEDTIEKFKDKFADITEEQIANLQGDDINNYQRYKFCVDHIKEIETVKDNLYAVKKTDGKAERVQAIVGLYGFLDKYKNHLFVRDEYKYMKPLTDEVNREVTENKVEELGETAKKYETDPMSTDDFIDMVNEQYKEKKPTLKQWAKLCGKELANRFKAEMGNRFPELSNDKKLGYKDINTEFTKRCREYAEKYLKDLQTKLKKQKRTLKVSDIKLFLDNKESHKQHFGTIKKLTEIDLNNDKFEYISRTREQLEKAYKDLKAGSLKWKFNTKYSDTLECMKELIDEHKEIEKKFIKARDQGKTMQITKDEIDRLHKISRSTLASIVIYVKGKNKKIIENGGVPVKPGSVDDEQIEANADILGENGGKRYTAMLNAAKILSPAMTIYKHLEPFETSKQERAYYTSEHKVSADVKLHSVESLNKNLAEQERKKEKLEWNKIGMNQLKENLKAGIQTAVDNLAQERLKDVQTFGGGNGGMTEAEFKAKIVKSSLDALMYEDNKLILNASIRYNKLKNRDGVRFIQDTLNGPAKNDFTAINKYYDSKKLNFYNNIFEENFNNIVFENAKQGKVSHKDVLEARDTVLKAMLATAHGNNDPQQIKVIKDLALQLGVNNNQVKKLEPAPAPQMQQ